jgi:hypothetical protein
MFKYVYAEYVLANYTLLFFHISITKVFRQTSCFSGLVLYPSIFLMALVEKFISIRYLPTNGGLPLSLHTEIGAVSEVSHGSFKNPTS